MIYTRTGSHVWSSVRTILRMESSSAPILALYGILALLYLEFSKRELRNFSLGSRNFVEKAFITYDNRNKLQRGNASSWTNFGIDTLRCPFFN